MTGGRGANSGACGTPLNSPPSVHLPNGRRPTARALAPPVHPGRGCKMQGGRPISLAESHWRRRELEEPLPKTKSREKFAGLQGRAGKSRVVKGADAGITKTHGTEVHGPAAFAR
jgi:hypothetical protein